MTRSHKLLARMRNNPAGDWRIADLQALAAARGWSWRQPGTSHVTFRTRAGAMLTVPAHKPIKPVYIRQFLRLIDEEEA